MAHGAAALAHPAAAQGEGRASGEGSRPLDLSVVVPLYNEEGSLPHLMEQLLAALRPLGLRFEMVLVDDGSRDGTAALLRDQAERVPELVAVLLRRN